MNAEGLLPPLTGSAACLAVSPVTGMYPGRSPIEAPLLLHPESPLAGFTGVRRAARTGPVCHGTGPVSDPTAGSSHAR